MHLMNVPNKFARSKDQISKLQNTAILNTVSKGMVWMGQGRGEKGFPA
jgi:hypothetical protein